MDHSIDDGKQLVAEAATELVYRGETLTAQVRELARFVSAVAGINKSDALGTIRRYLASNEPKIGYKKSELNRIILSFELDIQKAIRNNIAQKRDYQQFNSIVRGIDQEISRIGVERHTAVDSMARFFLERMVVDCEQQARFSELYAGEYVIVSWGLSGLMTMASFTIFPPLTSDMVPTFRTIRQTDEEQVRRVEGIIFQDGQTVQSYGFINGTSGPRFSLLHPYESRDGKADLRGFRASRSAMDPMGSCVSIYCRRVAEKFDFSQTGSMKEAQVVSTLEAIGDPDPWGVLQGLARALEPSFVESEPNGVSGLDDITRPAPPQFLRGISVRRPK